jgi:hypothetical protein
MVDFGSALVRMAGWFWQPVSKEAATLKAIPSNFMISGYRSQLWLKGYK